VIQIEIIIESNRKMWYSRDGKKFQKIIILFVIQLEIIIGSNVVDPDPQNVLKSCVGSTVSDPDRKLLQIWI
jgi:hypothetical protein